MSKWLNNKRFLDGWRNITKPCHVLDFCPYGQLVEEFPLHPKGRKKELREIECKTFGHDCPVFYIAEGVIEGCISEIVDDKKPLTP